MAFYFSIMRCLDRVRFLSSAYIDEEQPGEDRLLAGIAVREDGGSMSMCIGTS